MKEPWLVFSHCGKEVCAYTLRGTFAGERENTIRQLAADLGCAPEEITTEVVER